MKSINEQVLICTNKFMRMIFKGGKRMFLEISNIKKALVMEKIKQKF